ncbi:hypothetical protein BHM03_00007749 [Ensete ventricosum]|uniref:Uncharacterized protein n=1 Tax=Ensete ventricosum TaxID=4639 RepID=A0A445MC48_ENSVE|nr:hypothetical protein BHM03_00007749 [Ensete ventricosum]
MDSLYRELTEGIGSLLGWRKGVHQKKIETRRKIVKGSRKACQERCNGIKSKFARRFAEGIGKLTGNTSGDHRKKTKRFTVRKPEATGLAGVNRPYPGVRATESPWSTGKLPVPGFSWYV